MSLVSSSFVRRSSALVALALAATAFVGFSSYAAPPPHAEDPAVAEGRAERGDPARTTLIQEVDLPPGRGSMTVAVHDVPKGTIVSTDFDPLPGVAELQVCITVKVPLAGSFTKCFTVNPNVKRCATVKGVEVCVTVKE